MVTAVNLSATAVKDVRDIDSPGCIQVEGPGGSLEIRSPHRAATGAVTGDELKAIWIFASAEPLAADISAEVRRMSFEIRRSPPW